ncbi:response regulator transcription factor [Hahella ganghwensis]|uniref:response regulator transcription factor n=1 Tax=Hahella ganghwensis TaxID=286420 RepID=UPI000364BAB5|nr:response regulator transcription factor [Hahella ganghwensis]
MASESAIRLFMTVDKLLFRECLLYQLILQEEVDLVGESSSGVDTLSKLSGSGANVLIIEEDLKDNDGLTISEIALSQNPSLSIMLLVDSAISTKRLAIYLESGIKSVITKHQPVQEMIKALHYIKHGQVYVDADHYRLPSGAVSRNLEIFQSLSDREREVAQLMARRISVKSIAEQLGVSYKTVHSYKDRIFVKLGFERLPELVLFMKRFQNQLSL